MIIKCKISFCAKISILDRGKSFLKIGERGLVNLDLFMSELDVIEKSASEFSGLINQTEMLFQVDEHGIHYRSF